MIRGDLNLKTYKLQMFQSTSKYHIFMTFSYTIGVF